MKRTNIEKVMSDISLTYNESIGKIHKYLESAKSHKITIGENQDERTIQEIEKSKQLEKINQMETETKSKINAIIAEYEKAEKDFFTMKGDSITSDIELLKMNLSAEQVKDLQKRYSDNMTMLNAINEYAKSKNYNPLLIQSAESRIDILKTFEQVIFPRYRENAEVENPKYNFLETCEGYKSMQLAKVIDNAE